MEVTAVQPVPDALSSGPSVASTGLHSGKSTRVCSTADSQRMGRTSPHMWLLMNVIQLYLGAGEQMCQIEPSLGSGVGRAVLETAL
jgi:hypothetical protein